MTGDNRQDEFDDRTDDEGEGQPQPRRYGGGKYGSLEEFERGYSESFREVERLRGDAAAAKAEAEAYKRVLEEQRQYAQRPAAPDEPAYIPVEEEGVPRARIQQLAAQSAAEAAQRAVAEALKPLLMGANARTEMLRLHPEYGGEEAKVHGFLAENPRAMQLYQEVSQVNPIAGLELAYSTYRAATAQTRTKPEDDREVDRSRTQAGFPGSAGPTRRTDEKAEMSNRTYQKLLNEARETGDYDAFLNFRLSGVVPEGHIKRPA